MKDYDNWLIKNGKYAINYKLGFSRKIFYKRIDNWIFGLAFDEDIVDNLELLEIL